MGLNLWKSNGTGAGTVLVKDVQAGASSSQISNLFNHSGVLYFSADDGTSVRNFGCPMEPLSVLCWLKIFRLELQGCAGILASSGTTLFFSANTSATGRELWSVYDSLAPVSMVLLR